MKLTAFEEASTSPESGHIGQGMDPGAGPGSRGLTLAVLVFSLAQGEELKHRLL
jgi:hypothetical protein